MILSEPWCHCEMNFTTIKPMIYNINEIKENVF
jgi:hypothetical protein